jgi:outer membrane protein
MNKRRYFKTLAASGLLFSLSSLAHGEDLLSIYQLALNADPELKSAQAKVEIGSAQSGQALGQMLPQVSATGNWSSNQSRRDSGKAASNETYPGTRYYVSLNQSLIDFAKFWNWRRASRVEDQYTTEAIEAEHKLIATLVERYFDVLEAEDQLYFLQTEKQATEKQLQQIKKQFDKQLLKITDVYEVEARLDKIAAEEIIADTKRITAQDALRELTGVSPHDLSKLKTDVSFTELQGNLDEWVNMAIGQNPSVSAYAIAIDAAENGVIAQKSKYLPVVDLQLNYYDTNTGYQSQNLNSNTQTQVAAINVTVPIFDGFTTTNQMFEAQQRLQLSKNEHESALRALIKETSDSFLSTNASVRHIKASQKALESAIKSRQSMERGLTYAVVTVSDLLKSQQNEYQAQRDLSQAKYNYIKNRVRFMRAIGSINDQNLAEVNQWLSVPIAN